MSAAGTVSWCWSTSTTSRFWTHWSSARSPAPTANLRGLYGVIKACDAHVRFTFLTGVSTFTKVSVFFDLNNLTDLTLDRRYSAICGYTERDLDSVFAPEPAGLDREQVREWYHAYRWRGTDTVYNPCDVLLLFDSREFKVVELAPPGSALAQLRERGYADKYRGHGEPIHLIGVELSRETRNVTAFGVADS